MYAMVTRRTRNEARQQETDQQGEREFLPKLRQAPGFVAFYLIADGAENLAVSLWESQAQSETFMQTVQEWVQTLEQHGHQGVSHGGGEVLLHVTAKP